MTKKPHIRIHSDKLILKEDGCKQCVFGKGIEYCRADQIVGRNMRCTANKSPVSYELVSGDIKELEK